MKKLIFIATITIFTLTSCNQKTKVEKENNSEMMEHDSTMMTKDGKMMEHDSTMMHNDASKNTMGEKMYACPMHSEVQGKLNDKCSKCGMKLTEPVAENATK